MSGSRQIPRESGTSTLLQATKLGIDRNENPLANELVGLFEQNARRLAGAVRGILGPRADTQEVLQDAFLSAWNAVGRGDSPSDPTAWIFVLTLNLARDRRRQAQRRGPHHELEHVDESRMKVEQSDPAAGLLEAEALERARAAIFELEETQKEVFLLRASAGLTFEAVAEALSIPIGTAKSRMRAALSQLRTKLSDLDPTLLLRDASRLELEGEAR